MKSFVVFGLGRFGKAVADKLIDVGADVMVVDNDPDVIEQFADRATSAIVAELTDPEAIKATGIENIDCAIVAMGTSLEASIMCVMVSKECGIPFVAAKAGSERAGDILRKVGADQVIFPEEESGFRTARSLMSDSFLDYFELSSELCIVEMKPKKEWLGKSLRELNLRKRYGANVIAIRKGTLSDSIDPDAKIDASGTLLLLMRKSKADQLDDEN
ncbi:MAG: TrkA family potassium uptake protein [Firmicutes bacterium]|nr:TrkA family potassium uptake protein [Bacillota bacterium]